MARSPLSKILQGSAFEALPAMIGGVRRNLSIRQISTGLKKAGLTLNYTREIAPAVKALRLMEEKGRRVARMRRSTVIKVKDLPYAAGRQRRKYSYNVFITGVMDDGNPIERYLNVSTDRDDLSIQDVIDQAQEILDDNNEEYGITVSTMHVQFGQQRFDGESL
jgi:hypothetical protein